MDQTHTSADNPKLDALLAGYLEAVERGEKPDRAQLIAANPDLAAELQAFFTDLDRVQRVAADPAHASTVIRPDTDPSPGVIIAGRYKLLENIGEGGMGSVWVAEQLRPVKRRVAIKLIKAGMDSKQVLARFEAERQALAVMDHPNIAKVFDGGLTEQGRPYFVMEYVKGVPFTDYCDRARLPLKDRLSLFVQVCSAVQHAHQKGIIHRDLKPSNILICLYDGHPVPKVIDFGLAKAMHQPLTEQSIYTGHGVMVGTPLYMSPEQAELNNLDIDTRTDIYSLGVVLYELLTGSTPLERNQLQKAAFEEMLRLIKEVEPPRPSLRLSGSDSLPSIAAQRSIDPKQLSRSLAGDLDWIVMKTLDKERSRRYETANGLARDIERFLHEEPVEACPPSPMYRLRKYVKRHRGQVIAAGLVLLTLLLGIVGTSWGLRKAMDANAKTTVALGEVTKERDATEVERKKALKARQDAETAAKLLTERKVELEIANSKSTALLAEAAQSDRVIARDLWDRGQELDALAYSARALEYQPLSVAGLDDIVVRISSKGWPQTVATLTGHTGNVTIAEFSPDGTRIVTASYDNTARIWDAATGVLLAILTGHEQVLRSTVFSPDGTRIITASDDKTARVWGVSTGALLATLTGHEAEVYGAEFSPDGTRIVTASGDKTARIWDASTGALLATLTGHKGKVYGAEFSPDGTRIVTASEDNTAQIWNAATGSALATLTGHELVVISAEFSPDGTRIVTASFDNTARIWDAKTGAVQTTLPGRESYVTSAKFSPDGTRVVTTSDKEPTRVWDSATGAVLVTLTGQNDELSSAEFSPDGTRILTASVDKTARVWDVSTGALLAILTGHEDRIASAEFSLDGTRIVTASRDKTARIWNAATGSALATLTGHELVVISAEFSQDGTRIVTTSYDKLARIWDTATFSMLATLTGHEGSVLSAEFSPDGTRIVTASDDKTARIWDASTDTLLATLTGHEGDVYGAQFSPDGTRIVTASEDNTVRTWDASTGALLVTLTGHLGQVYQAVFSPDGTRIFTTSADKTARIWDSSTSAVLATLTDQNDYLSSAAFSLDGTRMFTASADKTARVWDVSTGAVLATLTGHEGEFIRAKFSPDGTKIVSDLSLKTVRVWDSSTGAVLATLLGHEDAVRSVEFSPDGTKIVTASVDMTARIWDASTGAVLAILTDQNDYLDSAAFSPDGTRIVSTSFNEPARIWEVAAVTGPPPAWFKTCLRFLGRRIHGASGELTVWPTLTDESQVATELRQAISADHTRYGDIARFLFIPFPEKPTYIGSKVTCGAAADQLIRPSASRSDLERAYGWHPNHPLSRVALAKFEDNPTRAEFLREYGVSRLLKRLPSAQEPVGKVAEYCRRAVALLIDQNDELRATLVLDRATALAPRHPDLDKLRDDFARLKINQGAAIPPPPPELETLIPVP